jgi:hypothetical protein
MRVAAVASPDFAVENFSAWFQLGTKRVPSVAIM